MWNKVLICLNDTSLTKIFKSALQWEIMENTTSTIVFLVAMTIVKKVLVLENQFYKSAPEIKANDNLCTDEQEIIHMFQVTSCLL